jgi:hypothetical protein
MLRLKFGAASAVVMVLAVVTPAGATAPSGRTVLATAIANAKKQGCVHEASRNTSDSRAGTIVSDVCTNAGQQVLSLSTGEIMNLIVRLDKGVAYVSPPRRRMLMPTPG